MINHTPPYLIKHNVDNYLAYIRTKKYLNNLTPLQKALMSCGKSTSPVTLPDTSMEAAHKALENILTLEVL